MGATVTPPNEAVSLNPLLKQPEVTLVVSPFSRAYSHLFQYKEVGWYACETGRQ